MERGEIAQILIGVLVLFVVISLGFVVVGNYLKVSEAFVFALIVVCVPVVVKKTVAYLLDASVEHEVWHVYRYGLKKKQHFKNELPFGILVPLLFSLISLGAWKVLALLTYETRALKHRAAKRFGFYSYSEMTDWHNGLIGAAGIVSLLLISMIAYFPGLEYLSKIAAYYAFWNMVPISKLDGTQIFFGSKILWAVLGIITLIFVFYGLVL